MKLIAFAIPLFFTLMGIEAVVAHFKKMSVYRFADSITNLSCGILQQLFGLFIEGTFIATYSAVYTQAHFFSLTHESWIAWVISFILVDIVYYLWHWSSHRVHFIWATHIPHHQSEDYNLSVALRQAMFSRLTNGPFYLVLALIGVEPKVFVICAGLNTLYQFWIHTETVKTLGPLEWILNTPSHHRVHHGINPQYIDRNHAGVFILWDRLFGTFQKETETPVFGIVTPHANWNPLWANFSHWAYLFQLAKKTQYWSDKIRLWFMPPEWKPADCGGVAFAPPVDAVNFKKFGTAVSNSLKLYSLAWFALSVIATTWLLIANLQGRNKWMAAMSIAATLIGLGALFQKKKWAIAWEIGRTGFAIVTAVLVLTSLQKL